jgi:hypothetical protein
MLEAIKLRDQITGRKMDESEGSSVEELVKNALKVDAGKVPDKGTSGDYPPATTEPATQPATQPAVK